MTPDTASRHLRIFEILRHGHVAQMTRDRVCHRAAGTVDPEIAQHLQDTALRSLRRPRADTGA